MRARGGRRPRGGVPATRLRACAAALALLACGGPAPAPDAGADAGPPGALRVWIGGPRHVVAGERACFVAVPNQEVDSVRWIWDDDVLPSRELEGCRAWRFVGPRVIGVEVSARGMRASASFEVRVVPRPSEPRPTSSSPILVHQERVWVVNPDSDTISGPLDGSAAAPRRDRRRRSPAHAGRPPGPPSPWRVRATGPCTSSTPPRTAPCAWSPSGPAPSPTA
ncbi:MAG: hypothetical protein M5U28_50445 [Sandaracinaceae bacterium]|nr:hypothetical protein [Sandaracinaceae bacterium]